MYLICSEPCAKVMDTSGSSARSMKELENLQRRWRDGVRLEGLRTALSLEKDGLVLGATRLLHKQEGTGALQLEGQEARLLALLSVAYARPVNPSIFGNIRRASKHAAANDDAMAAMHLALAGLPRLADPPDAARRLFIADGLLAMGVWRATDPDARRRQTPQG